MKFDQKLRDEFKEKYGSYTFEKGVVGVFLESYLTDELDPEKLKEKEKGRIVHLFIQGFKDAEGIREAVAFNSALDVDEPEQLSYAFITENTPERILERQRYRIFRQITGLNRTLAKIDAQLKAQKNQGAFAVSETGELTVEQASL